MLILTSMGFSSCLSLGASLDYNDQLAWAVLRGGASIMAGDTDLIAAIYDAIIDPSGWDEVVKRIVEATKSFSGICVSQFVAIIRSYNRRIDDATASGAS